MKLPKRWKLFLDKAAQDERAADLLAPLKESADEIVGFHLQQAAEKLIKALLTFRGIEFRHTHNLGELIHLLEKHGEILPEDIESVRELTPYATEWRYDFIEEEGSIVLDRARMRNQVGRLREWVETRIRIAGQE